MKKALSYIKKHIEYTVIAVMVVFTIAGAQVSLARINNPTGGSGGSGTVSAGVAGQVAVYSAATTVGGSTSLTFQNSILGIGTGGTTWYQGLDASNNYGISATQSGGVLTSPYLTVAGSGFVGINNSAPGQFLDVGGFINTNQFSGYKQNGNTVLYASTTNSSVAIGASAAAAWMSATSTVIRNVAIGLGALGTGPSTSGGGTNVAVGVNSLANDTSGLQNTAVGYQSLQNESSATNNVAIGFQAMAASVGQFSTAVGWAALTGSGSGGSFNTALGYQSMGNMTNTGSNNTAVGFKSLFNLSTGNLNVALGYNSGQAITTGGTNVFIGNNTASTTATGASNIAIGNDIAFPVNNGSNQLDIGNLIFGTNVTSQGSSTPAGSLGIATSTFPLVQLSLGTVGSTNGTSTTAAGKLQWDGYNSAGVRMCAYFNAANTLVTQAGACNF